MRHLKFKKINSIFSPLLLSIGLPFTLTLIFNFSAVAAPFPGTSTSALTAPETSYHFLHRGFFLSSQTSSWKPMVSSDESILDTIRFGAATKGNGSLSIRTDKISKNTTLDLYSRKWMRDYPSYGFEVAAARTIQLNGAPTLVVDMYARSREKQIRQVISKNEDRVAIMTCVDDKVNFKDTLKECNKIVNTFKWTDLKPAPLKAAIEVAPETKEPLN